MAYTLSECSRHTKPFPKDCVRCQWALWFSGKRKDRKGVIFAQQSK